MIEALRKILDGTIDDLEEALLILECDEQLLTTARMRRDYLLGDLEGLERLADLSYGRLKNLIRIKLAIRSGEEVETMRNAYLKDPYSEASPFSAEAAITLAIAAEQMGDDNEAERLYQSAYKLCRAHGLEKRAASAYHNIVACRSRLYPNKRLIYEYNRAVRMALESQAFPVAGTALANLAREYQRAGALEVAAETVDRAVDLLRERQFGTYQYFFALCDRCDIAMERGFISDAQLDFSEVRIAPFPEIRAAASHLAKRALELGHRWQTDDSDPMARAATAWRSRDEEDLPRLRQKLGLSVLEQRLVALLLEHPHGFMDLIDHVYPDSIPFEAKENRLKQLIYRVRQKWPDLICHKNGMYRIASNRFLKLNPKALAIDQIAQP